MASSLHQTSLIFGFKKIQQIASINVIIEVLERSSFAVEIILLIVIRPFPSASHKLSYASAMYGCFLTFFYSAIFDKPVLAFISETLGHILNILKYFLRENFYNCVSF